MTELHNENDKICVICGTKYEGFGNNAYPLAEGECCNECNQDVIVARIKQLQGRL